MARLQGHPASMGTPEKLHKTRNNSYIFPILAPGFQSRFLIVDILVVNFGKLA